MKCLYQLFFHLRLGFVLGSTADFENPLPRFAGGSVGITASTATAAGARATKAVVSSSVVFAEAVVSMGRGGVFLPGATKGKTALGPATK